MVSINVLYQEVCEGEHFLHLGLIFARKDHFHDFFRLEEFHVVVPGALKESILQFPPFRIHQVVQGQVFQDQQSIGILIVFHGELLLMSFVQEAPTLGNQFSEDPFLGELLKFYEAKNYEGISKDLLRLGRETVSTYYPLSINAELNPPRLTNYSVFGK